MLDVHPPHESVRSWKDFLIHIATICIGLLIAVGLEQAVEAFHRQRERQELRESLRRESEQVIHDCERVEPAMTIDIRWHRQFADVLLKSSREHKPVGEIAPLPHMDFDIPGDPVYLAAKASNELDLLTQQEIQAYGELDVLLDQIRLAYQRRTEARDSARKTTAALPISNPGVSAQTLTRQGVTLTPGSLEELYKSTITTQIGSAAFRYWTRQARGAALELQQGDHDLQKIQAAERQFDKLP